jgi:hypothetical protein
LDLLRVEKPQFAQQVAEQVSIVHTLWFVFCIYFLIYLFFWLLLQIYDNALITAGLMDDPRSMVNRLNDVLTEAVTGEKAQKSS